MTDALPWYSDQEVDDLCTGLKNNAAKVRHLQALGLTVSRKPNGRPLLMRAHAEAVLHPKPPQETPPAVTTMPAPSIPWEQTPLGRSQQVWRESKAAEQAELDALPKPTREELRAAMREAEHRRKQARAALVRFHASRRRVAKLQRTPPWADQDAIRAIYTEAARLSTSTGLMHHVDHIYPLQGALVSGLHVQNNLQILPWRENVMKRNKFEVTQ